MYNNAFRRVFCVMAVETHFFEKIFMFIVEKLLRNEGNCGKMFKIVRKFVRRCIRSDALGNEYVRNDGLRAEEFQYFRNKRCVHGYHKQTRSR